MINLVRTQIGERFFNNLLGTSIESSMFELTTSDITTVLKEEISTLLNNFEPRIRFRNVAIEIVEDYNELNISIEYDIVGLSVPTQNIEFILQPTRV